MALLCATVTTALSRPAVADTVTGHQASHVVAHQASRIVATYQGVWTSPPSVLTNGETTDAPLMGNGDIGVAVGGTIDHQTMYIGKNDFWSSSTHAIKPLGRIVVSAAGLKGSSYNVVQDIQHAEVRGTYTLNGQTLSTTSWTDANSGTFVTSFTLTGGNAQPIGITLQNGSGGEPSISTTDTTKGDARNADLDADVYADTGTGSDPHARIAARTLGRSQSISGDTITMTIQPGTTSTLVAGIVSSIDQPSSWQSSADALVSGLTQSKVDKHKAAHRSWWQRYWSQSYVEIPDKAVEKSWYGSLYLLGCVSRSGKYAPGLWGNWVTGKANWNGDYHTNYNYEAPFYSALSTNHIAQMDSYDQPVLDWQSAGEALAAQNGFTGVLYPVGLSPKGTSSDTHLYNQKSNAAFVASDMVMRYEYTHDPAYAAKVYPFLKQVGRFWQDYLVKDSTGTYNDYNDAPQEGAAYPQTNAILSLGLIHLLMHGLVDMSTALGQDAALIPTWQDIDTHLAPLPTMARNNQTVFRETSVGNDWVNDENDIAIQAVYPGLQVGLDSDPNLLQTARNTVGQLARWHGYNAPATFYAAAAMVGYDPRTILSNLNNEATAQSYRNLAVHHGGGGIENLNVTTSGLDEMLLQSFQNDIKVFPNWPANTSAKFGDLLAYGDFLVSSSTASNSVQYIQAVSQAGGTFTFTNPWPGSVEVYRNGHDNGTVTGTKITLSTSAGDVLDLAPAGTSLATIRTELSQPMQPSPTSSFSSGFESTDPAPTWADTVDTTAGGLAGVTGICCGLTGPQAGTRTNEKSHTGSSALMYSGSAQGGDSVHAYTKIYDLTSSPLAIGAGKTLSYWIYPQSNATTSWVPAGSTESECVAVDLVFTDGSTLSDSGAVDQNGQRIHPAYQCGHLTLDTWNHVTVNLGTDNADKQIDRITVAYDHPAGTGGYRGYIDDLTIS
ncbi:glycosyl hydrolase family 95 catalytic domain-containing protein [Streptomyces sp. NPDC020917]|uniref:glycosyl hydrolase family 95 catalytic domain-containing protein n=1 Tax=Streptomyces sp. NPDC020917 TaxID=3365102 RepID=UPI0037955B50